MTGCSGDSTQAEGADSLIVGRRLTPAGTSQRRQAGRQAFNTERTEQKLKPRSCSAGAIDNRSMDSALP